MLRLRRLLRRNRPDERMTGAAEHGGVRCRHGGGHAVLRGTSIIPRGAATCLSNVQVRLDSL